MYVYYESYSMWIFWEYSTSIIARFHITLHQTIVRIVLLLTRPKTNNLRDLFQNEIHHIVVIKSILFKLKR